MKKRSFLVLAAASALMLAGCVKKPAETSGSKSDTSSAGSQSEVSADISATEGKTTFYFALGGSLQLPSYTSIFLTGGFLNWAEKVGEAVEMQKLEGSANIYYGLVDELEVGSTADKYYEFQLTIGYNATSGAPSTGVNWNYKSNECIAAGGDAGLDNLSFEVVDGLVNLGTHTWDELPPDPAESAIHNFKIEAKFSAAVPEYVDLYLVGDHLAWSFDEKTKLVPNADRTSFTQTIDTILGNTYGVKLMAQYAGEAADWNHAVLADGTGNYSMMVKKTWGDNHTLDLAAQAFDALVIDTEVFTIDWATFMPELGEKVAVGVKLVSPVALSGTWEARGSWDASWNVPVALTANEAKTEFTGSLGDYPAGQTIQFKLKLESTWQVAIGNESGENILVTVGEEDMLVTLTLDNDVAAMVNEQIANLSSESADYTAAATITGNGTAPAFVPADHTWGIVGIADDWENDIPMVANAGNTEWSATIAYAAATTSYGFQIRADGAWDIQYGNLYLAENPGTEAKGNITLADGNYVVTLSFTAELTPVIAVSAVA